MEWIAEYLRPDGWHREPSNSTWPTRLEATGDASAQFSDYARTEWRVVPGTKTPEVGDSVLLVDSSRMVDVGVVNQVNDPDQGEFEYHVIWRTSGGSFEPRECLCVEAVA